MTKNKFSLALLGALLMSASLGFAVNAQGPSILPEPMVAPAAVALPSARVSTLRTRPVQKVNHSQAVRNAPIPHPSSIVAEGRITHVQNAESLKHIAGAAPLAMPAPVLAPTVAPMGMGVVPIGRPSLMDPAPTPAPVPTPTPSN